MLVSPFVAAVDTAEESFLVFRLLGTSSMPVAAVLFCLCGEATSAGGVINSPLGRWQEQRMLGRGCTARVMLGRVMHLTKSGKKDNSVHLCSE